MKKPEERIFLTDDTRNEDGMSAMVGVFRNACVNEVPESWRELFENCCAVPGSCIGEKMFFKVDKKGVTGGRALFEEGLLDKSNFQGWMLKPSKNDDALPYDILSDGIVPDVVPGDVPDDVLLSFASCPAPHVRRWSRLTCDRRVGAMLAGKGLLPKETLLRLLREHAATDLAPFLASAGVDMKDVDFPDEVLDRRDEDGTTVAMALAGVGMLPEEKFEGRLDSINLQGDTLLHFAARSGRFPERFATDESASRRNMKWATPRDETLLHGLRAGTLSDGEKTELREALLRPLGNRETHTLGFRLLQDDLRTAKLLPPDVLVRILMGKGPDEEGEIPLDDFLEREHSEGFGGILSEELLNARCEAPDAFGETGRTFGEVLFLHIKRRSKSAYINPVRLLDGEGNVPAGLTERTLAAGADRGLPLAAAVSEILPLPLLSDELLSSRLGESASRFFKLESPCTLAHFLTSRGVFQPAMAEMLEEPNDGGTPLACVAAKSGCLPESLLSGDVLRLRGGDGETVASLLARRGELPLEFVDGETPGFAGDALRKLYGDETVEREAASRRSFESVEAAENALSRSLDVDDERCVLAVGYLRKALGGKSEPVVREALGRIADVDTAKRVVLLTVERDRRRDNPRFAPAVEMLEKTGVSVEDLVIGDGRAAKELLATVLSEDNREEKSSEREVLVEALRIVSLMEHGEYEGYVKEKWNLRSFFLKPLKGMSPEDFHDPLVLAVDAESERDAKRLLRTEVRKVAERKRREWESGAGFEETEESVVL